MYGKHRRSGRYRGEEHVLRRPLWELTRKPVYVLGGLVFCISSSARQNKTKETEIHSLALPRSLVILLSALLPERDIT